jgi:HTH-type transcriptional regulator, competence development regulator
MLTAFGKAVRKLRLDSEGMHKLKDLADALDVSSAYLSAVETGKKSASPDLVDRIADLFGVDVKKRRELHQLASETARTVQLSLVNGEPKSRQVAVMFARRFPSFSEETLEKLLQVIEHDRTKTKT